MGRLDYCTRSKVVDFWQRNYQLRYIQAHLSEEGIQVSKKSLCLLIKKYKNTGSVADACKARRPRKLQEHYRFIDDAMAENDQLTSRQLHQSLQEAFPEVEVSISCLLYTSDAADE